MDEKKRILVVDDEPDFASIVQGNLEKEGFEVEVAYNGVEGLEKTHANQPDAIVLDVMRPEMDGYEMCNRRYHPKRKKIAGRLVTKMSRSAFETTSNHLPTPVLDNPM